MNEPIRVYTKTIDLKAEIDSYSSLEYERNFHEVGEFELKINQHAHDADKFEKGDIITIGDDPSKAGQILHKEIELTEEGKESEEWTIKGPTLQGIISQRITVPPKDTSHDRKSGAAETVMKHYVRNNFVDPKDDNRKIDDIIIAEDQERGKDIRHESRYKNVDEEVSDISKDADIGWTVYIDFSRKKFVFDVLEGNDLTQDNEHGNNPVFFSPDYGTIKEQEFSDSDLDMVNFGYVAGQGEGKDRKIVTLGDNKGINRFEDFIDARDIGSGGSDDEDNEGQVDNLISTDTDDLNEDHFINFRTGKEQKTTKHDVTSTIYIKAKEKTNYEGKELYTKLKAGVAFYDDDKKFIDGVQKEKFKTPKDTKYIRLTIKKGNDNDAELLNIDELKEKLKERGEEKMDDKKTELSLDAEILSPTVQSTLDWKDEGFLQSVQPYGHFEREETQAAPFVYERDFDLGDKVTVYNGKWGVVLTARMTKFKESHESDGFKLEATFGRDRPTLISKIKNKFDELSGVDKQELPDQLIKEHAKDVNNKLTDEERKRIRESEENLNKAREYSEGAKTDSMNESGVHSKAERPIFERSDKRKHKGVDYDEDDPVFDANGLVVDSSEKESFIIPTMHVLDEQEGTIEAEFIDPELGDNHEYIRLDFDNDDYRFIVYGDEDGHVYCAFGKEGDSNDHIKTDADAIESGSAFCIAVKWSARSKTYTLFVDDEKIGTGKYDQDKLGEFSKKLIINNSDFDGIVKKLKISKRQLSSKYLKGGGSFE